MDAYTNDGIQLAGLKAKAPNGADYEVVGDFYSEEPYGMAMRKGDAKFKHAVDTAIDGNSWGRQRSRSTPTTTGGSLAISPFSTCSMMVCTVLPTHA